MATWQQLAADNIRVAHLLFDQKEYRSSITRAYYAVYSAITSELVNRQVIFARGWNNPSHDQLVRLIQRAGFVKETRRGMGSTILFLRRAREDADYRPTVTVDRETNLKCLRMAAALLRDLERANDRAK